MASSRVHLAANSPKNKCKTWLVGGLEHVLRLIVVNSG